MIESDPDLDYQTIGFFRGCFNACLIVLPFWCVLLGGIAYLVLR